VGGVDHLAGDEVRQHHLGERHAGLVGQRRRERDAHAVDDVVGRHRGDQFAAKPVAGQQVGEPFGHGVGEVVGQQRLQLAFLLHRVQYVGVPVELPIDEDLRKRGPVGHAAEGLALCRIRQHVDDLVGIPVFVEELHGLPSEATHGHRLGALPVDEDLIRRDLPLNLVFDWICHGVSFCCTSLVNRHSSRPL
jgi:hypothetical protein